MGSYWWAIRTMLIAFIHQPTARMVGRLIVRQATASLVRHIRNTTREARRSGVERMNT